MLASQSVSNSDGIRERFISKLENAIQANQTINIGDSHPIDLLAQYQLGIRNYDNVVVYHNEENPKNMYQWQKWETVYVRGTVHDRKKAMMENSDFLCLVCNSPYESNLDIDNYNGRIHFVTKGVNISSSEGGIGGALCINDRQCRQNGLIKKEYPVIYQGKRYNCAIDLFTDETKKKEFFQLNNNPESLYELDDRDWLGHCLTEKFKSNPRLWLAVKKRGGIYFLEGCTHYKKGVVSPYEGDSVYSVYICFLIDAYINAEEFCDI